MPDRTYEWYRTVVDQGNFEVVHGRERFYGNSKLHLAFATGSLALVSYAVAKQAHLVLLLGMLVAGLGVLNAVLWLRQVAASAWWERRWRAAAAEMEAAPDFREAVGLADFRAWSHEEAERAISSRATRPGASIQLYQSAVWSWVVFHGLVSLLIIVYLVWSLCRSIPSGV